MTLDEKKRIIKELRYDYGKSYVEIAEKLKEMGCKISASTVRSYCDRMESKEKQLAENLKQREKALEIILNIYARTLSINSTLYEIRKLGNLETDGVYRVNKQYISNTILEHGDKIKDIQIDIINQINYNDAIELGINGLCERFEYLGVKCNPNIMKEWLEVVAKREIENQVIYIIKACRLGQDVVDPIINKLDKEYIKGKIRKIDIG